MPLVQLVERRFPKPEVVGSRPTGHVLFLIICALNKKLVIQIFVSIGVKMCNLEVYGAIPFFFGRSTCYTCKALLCNGVVPKAHSKPYKTEP